MQLKSQSHTLTKRALFAHSTAKESGRLGIFTKTQVKLTAQGLQRFHDFVLQDQSAKLLPKERVSNCLKKRIDKYKNRSVRYNEVREKAHWANVQRCGGVWICPVCAKQITEKRREELKQGIERWKTVHSGSVLLLTLTFSHSITHPLKMSLEGLRKATKIFLENSKVKAIQKLMGVEHKVNSLEVTYGQNGWHPHRHILLLVKGSFDYSKYLDELKTLWIKSCVRAGLSAPSMQHGLDIRDGEYASNYVSKWGLESELTKGHVKKGRGSYTPFDLLNYSCVDADDVFRSGRSAASLYQEYGVAIKGQRQLSWSRGLKALLLVEEKTDEELAQETEKDSIELLEVQDYIFSILCHYQQRHVYLKCLENDWKDGSFGNGSAEHLLIELLEKELEKPLGFSGGAGGNALPNELC